MAEGTLLLYGYLLVAANQILTSTADYGNINFVAKLVNSFLYNKESNGSNVRVAQLDRASGYGPEGRVFESCHARQKIRLK